jgi:hypothetical protein
MEGIFLGSRRFPTSWIPPNKQFGLLRARHHAHLRRTKIVAHHSHTHLPQECSAHHARRRKITSFAHVSSRSQFDPFYGYPINPELYPSAPFPLLPLRYGRRQKRDLIRTLVALWWEKWRSRVSWTFSLLFIFFCARWWWRQRRKSVFFIRSRPNEV